MRGSARNGAGSVGRSGRTMRSHLRAGRPRAEAGLDGRRARAASVVALGHARTSRPASTTVLPSRVGRRLHTWSRAEGRGDARDAALEAGVAAEQVDAHHAAVGQHARGRRRRRPRRRAPARRPRGRTGRRAAVARCRRAPARAASRAGVASQHLQPRPSAGRWNQARQTAITVGLSSTAVVRMRSCLWREARDRAGAQAELHRMALAQLARRAASSSQASMRCT